DPKAVGRDARWMMPGTEWPGRRTINVPGCWEAQGVGEPGISQPWDMNDRGPYPLSHIYMGSAWYRRTVSVPASWRDKRVWLKIGGVRAQGWFWVNGKPVAHAYNYCSTEKYDVTDLVTPGQKAVLVVLVRNDIPSRKGSTGWRHRAGGLYRDVELEATPGTWIDNLWVKGDFDKQAAEVRATIVCATEASKLKNPLLRVKVTTKTQSAGEGNAQVVFVDGQREVEAVCRVSLSPFRAWSPESPVLYQAEVTLYDGDTPVHGWTERFGVRKLEVRSDRFFLNGKPFFIRGYGDDHIYPLTLLSPASQEKHLKNLKIARSAGFNYVRLHTHCELPEYFEAASEAGILVQAELPYNHAAAGENFLSDPKRDLVELIMHYQRYVSLATCCMGNEGGFSSPLDCELYNTAKKLNPDLLVLHHDQGKNTRENSDFGSGPIAPWKYGSFKSDVPFVCHEYLNLSVKADPRLASRFKGMYLPSLASLDMNEMEMVRACTGFPKHISAMDCAPRDMKTYEADLKRVRLTRAWGDACQDAAHALQRYYQKQGVESARLEPSCDGYSFWTIVDVLFQAQGLFNVFWEPKSGGATPEEFRVMNGPTVILRRSGEQSPVAVTGQTLKHTWYISHFGGDDLKNTKLVWTLRTDKTILTGGNLEIGNVAVGDVRELGQCEFTVPPLECPVHAVLEARIEGHDIFNQWDFWFFPERKSQTGAGLAATRRLHSILISRFPGLALAGTPEGDAAQVLIASEGDPELLAALEAGRRLVLLDRCKAPDNVKLGWWLLGEQTGTAMARHRVFGDFPHVGHLSPLWFRIIKRPELLLSSDGFCGAEPLMVGDGIHGYALYLCQAKVGAARLIRACGLDLLSSNPENVFLLDAILSYARSKAFRPKVSLDPGKLAVQLKNRQLVYNELNGWKRTLKADETRSAGQFFGTARSSVLSLPKGKNELEWETMLPAEGGSGAEVTFRWVNVTSVNVWKLNVSEKIVMSLDGKKVLIYTADIFKKEWTVRDGEAVLTFRGMDYTQNSITGVMELTVPRSWLRPASPCVIKLIPENPSGEQFKTGIIEVNTLF
ncbi:MAG: hypothetical protein PHR77_20980, partial [Kiritimatiellae bacterium]|nr:hypothetical protein [Kiritimatiellia bacterium]